MKGQTLIEVLIALAVATVVISAITVTAITSLSSAQFIQKQNISTKYAQEGIETMRQIRNSDYVGFRVFNGLYCFAQAATILGSPVATCNTVNLLTDFVRSVDIRPNGCGTNVSSVTVKVSFTSSKCAGGAYCHTSHLASCLSTVDPIVGL